MLRLVCCDVDGTLLPKTEQAIAPETLDMLRRLCDKGITVVIASGRPYAQLRPLFGALSHRLVFICLDGALTLHRDCVLHKRPLSRSHAVALLQTVDGALVHGRETIYRIGNAPAGARDVSSPNEIGEPFLKLELFSKREPNPDYWFRVAYREPGLTELVAPCANKGAAIETLLQKFGISRDQAAAFGDGENDVELLQAVGHPFLMSRAPRLPALLTVPRIESVADTLRELFL